MTVEERLTRALREEAERIEVDRDRLYAATRRRLSAAPARRPSRLPRGTQPVLAAAVLAALVVGVVVLVHRDVGPPAAPRPSGHSQEGQVSSVFACPGQITTDRAGRQDDDSFLPSLARGPQAAADDVGAPRYSFEHADGRATLRMGNADGSLASTSTFLRVSGRWALLVTRKCAAADTGVLVPHAGPLRLGRRDTTPYPARTLVDEPSHAVLVDDRSTYDESGLSRHRSLWASTCGAKICFAGGTPGDYVYSDVRAGRPPADLTSLLLDPDSTVGRPRSLVLWAVYDADDSVPSVVVQLRDGSTLPARRFEGPGWRGRAYVLLAPRAEATAVLVRHADGSATTYPVSDITGP